MIVRAILKHPEMIENEEFDYFNDFQDTYMWLDSLETEEAKNLMKKLKEKNDIFIKNLFK